MADGASRFPGNKSINHSGLWHSCMHNEFCTWTAKDKKLRKGAEKVHRVVIHPLSIICISPIYMNTNLKWRDLPFSPSPPP